MSSSHSSKYEGKPTLQELEQAAGVYTSVSEPLSKPQERRAGRQFLAGPLDWPELCLVAKLGGAALEVWLLLHLRRKLKAGPWISLPNPRLAEMGVDRFAKQRALAALRQDGLIHIARSAGKPTLVALVREQRP